MRRHKTSRRTRPTTIDEFSMVTVGDLGRDTSAILDRVKRGDRVIVRRYNEPIATIQPLNGLIRQPFDPAAYDVGGSILGDLRSIAAALSRVERDLLLTCNPHQHVDKISISRLPEKWLGQDRLETLESMRLRGLTKKTHRGWLATGLGLAVRDELARMVACGEITTEVVDPRPILPPWYQDDQPSY